MSEKNVKWEVTDLRHMSLTIHCITYKRKIPIGEGGILTETPSNYHYSCEGVKDREEVLALAENFLFHLDPNIFNTILGRFSQYSQWPEWDKSFVETLLTTVDDFRTELVYILEILDEPEHELKCPSCGKIITRETWDKHRECPQCGTIVNPANA